MHSINIKATAEDTKKSVNPCFSYYLFIYFKFISFLHLNEVVVIMFVVLDVTFWSFWEDTVIFGGSNEQK